MKTELQWGEAPTFRWGETHRRGRRSMGGSPTTERGDKPHYFLYFGWGAASPAQDAGTMLAASGVDGARLARRRSPRARTLRDRTKEPIQCGDRSARRLRIFRVLRFVLSFQTRIGSGS